MASVLAVSELPNLAKSFLKFFFLPFNIFILLIIFYYYLNKKIHYKIVGTDGVESSGWY
jgi:ABC-type amino acid transport system permease subunit